MLVLTRKLQEKIRIGDQIIITVLRTKGKAVRLGIEAPTDVPVIRGELAFESGDCQPSDVSVRGDAAANRLLTADDMRREPDAGCDRQPWPTKAPSERAAAVPPGAASAVVHFERVPRRQLAGVLPQPAVAAGPLRAMLDRRSSAT